MFDATQRIADAREYFDELLDSRIAEISRLSGVSREHFVKINPADFAKKTKFMTIAGYEYRDVGSFIREKKTDETFLISPVDAVRETAAQVAYKQNVEIRRTIRASKCDVIPVPPELAQDFFLRNHRQSPPLIRNSAVCFGLVYKNELVAVMLYDISNGAVRGNKREYELVRLAISRGTRIHGGASKLQSECEKTLLLMGEKVIYSYSNATINNGNVYEKLGFVSRKIETGQPFVILRNNRITRLINLYPQSTDKALALNCHIKCFLGGNRIWRKELTNGTTP